METGELTPRSNDLVAGMRFTGAFGQPDGFGSVLLAQVKQDGRLCLTFSYRKGYGQEDKEHQWTIELDNEQRNRLAAFAAKYQPNLYEYIYPESES